LAKMDSRNARRMMQRMGMQMDEVKNVSRVIIQMPQKEIVIEGPMVTSINVQGQKMYQVTGGKLVERATQAVTTVESEEKKQPTILEEDILLVAQQGNVSMEKARATLIKCEGDLAKAILMLQTGG
jgi:alpha-NAC-related protein